MIIKKDSTSISTPIVFVSKTTGLMLTTDDITLTDIDLSYYREGDTAHTKANATAGVLNSFTANSVAEISKTEMPGLFQVDWPNAAFATGVGSVILQALHVDAHSVLELVELVDYDLSDVIGADGDTLKSLSDQVDAQATAAALVTHDTDIKAFVDKIDDATDGLTAIKNKQNAMHGGLHH